MNLIKLNIIGLSYSQFKSGAYVLFLEEDNGVKKLPIVIGACEAQAIALKLDRSIKPPRPVTHDLFVSIAKKSRLIIDKIIIHKLEKGIFFSSIKFVNKNTEETFIIDSRTSDAIAISLRFKAPIYTYKKILDAANNDFKEDSEKIEISQDNIEEMTTKESKAELEKKLAIAIQNENYELAAKIRDQIKKIDD